ncbi:MAG: 23S rRNA (adenine(2030)-N(6))-methyltransferase RlmJ [Nitratireductor sp.]|nr:23S rRNA (adenine(2030)-N(6))-methyltransferase RlmJ [Nitratireductor sp.]MCB1455257.1 23S rRNA (adenine(2030)-N(6))-methyltransferase RlmJ [Nitratireductor sp.]
MNYRHAFHAGNFADVFKHVVLTRIIEYLKRKEAAFRVIDTHAGRGLYDLASVEAGKTGEWINGIGKIAKAGIGGKAGELLAPYLRAVLPEEGEPVSYPGSPLIARRLLRKQDRLSAFELHPEDHAALADQFAGDWQARINLLDGWLVPGAHLPPKERRGLVLIDPPFEIAGEFDRMTAALEKADRRWPGGIVMLWYPLKHDGEVERFASALRASTIRDLVRVELQVKTNSDEPGLYGSGLIIRNPPFVLQTELETILPSLVDAMALDSGAAWRLDRLTQE